MSGIKCVHSSNINMFTNRIDKYLVRAGYVWTLDKPTASLFAAAVLMAILLNLVNPILHELK